MPLPPFQLERYFARYEFNVRHLLCSSDCESVTVNDLLSLEAGAADALEHLWLGYTESRGAPALRQAIGRLYDTIGPDQVLVHSGAEEAIFLFMHAALAPGDHVIVHWPCYQSLHEVARSIGCEVTFWQAGEDRGWSLDPDDLMSHIRSTTRAVIINTPHNPTGWLMPRDEFRHLNRILDERDILLFSDEVYRELEYSTDDRLPAACDLSERAVSLGVMSKTYGLPGLRIGWVATRNAGINARMAALKDYTTICNSAPSELLAEIALRHRQGLIRRNLAIITANLKILDDFFGRYASTFAWVRPKAGPIAFVHLKDGAVESFCHELVRRKGVLLLPGNLYGHHGNHFRIGFGRQDMPAALEALEPFIASRDA
jgi:aspartate/methionine/tyrosine aminotransferase